MLEGMRRELLRVQSSGDSAPVFSRQWVGVQCAKCKQSGAAAGSGVVSVVRCETFSDLRAGKSVRLCAEYHERAEAA